MPRITQMILLIPFLLLLCCGERSGRTDEEGRLRIVTTIGMITDIVERVGGDRVSVIGLMGPGVDPHLYRASEGDVSRMAQAAVVFYNGLHLEGAMSDVLEHMNRRVKTVAVTSGIEKSGLLSPLEFEGAHDPHVWFDVTLWMRAVERVRETLVEVDSAGSAYYHQQAGDLRTELQQLHEYVRQQAERVPAAQRVLITAHDAFNYFGQAYGFEVRGLQGISTAAEAGTADVQALADFIAKRRIPAVFVESSVPSRSIEAVQAAVRSRGLEVSIGGELFSDALGSPGTPEGTYVGMVRHNIDTIVAALLSEQSQEENR
jgi:manganese/zinc/iron transport system substrate-binding protein